MRLRGYIGFLALVGVLLHAGAIVRHNTVMASAMLQHQALLGGLAQLCHGGAGAKLSGAAELPYVPPPSDAQNGCPICSGLSPAVTIVAPDLGTFLAPASEPATLDCRTHRVSGSAYPICPQARAPPSAA